MVQRRDALRERGTTSLEERCRRRAQIARSNVGRNGRRGKEKSRKKNLDEAEKIGRITNQQVPRQKAKSSREGPLKLTFVNEWKGA